LHLLRFAELEGGDIKLTAIGKRFVDSEVDDRKRMFAQQLATYVPAAHIRRVLDDRPSYQAPARRYRDELEDYMAATTAAETLRTVISWARYAEYFAFDENADQFSLENPS
jgi:NitT/TauT family transport system ATP-binding protein